jgi:hypothetical protein
MSNENKTLNKPFRNQEGSSKKFSVYVKDGDDVKKVSFGDPNMEIRRDNDKARESFRARHNCDEANDKTTPKYWSCKMWEKGKSVSQVLNSSSEVDKAMNDLISFLQKKK